MGMTGTRAVIGGGGITLGFAFQPLINPNLLPEFRASR